MNRAVRTHMIRGLCLAAATGALALASTTAQAKPRPTGEEELTKALEGRVMGKPVDCINLSTVSSSRIYDKAAIVYEVGSTWYVQRPKSGAEDLDDDDVLVTRSYSSELCSVDVINLHDRMTRSWRGWVGLDKFVPYTKPPKAPKAS